MATYSDLKREAQKISEPYVDVDCHEGEFGVTAEVLGATAAYFLKGNPGADDAIIQRRESYTDRGTVRYEGGGVFGGRLVREFETSTDA